jgi:hypothetical protein
VRLHLQVADWIQNVAPGRDVETAELASYHYREAIGYGEDDPEASSGSAYAVLMTAGERAHAPGGARAALEHLEAALRPGARPQTRRARRSSRWPRRSLHIGRLDETAAVAGQGGCPRGPRRPAPLGRARLALARLVAHRPLGGGAPGVERRRGRARRPPESLQLARALARRSQLEMLRNRPEAAEHSREAIEVARRVGDAFAEVNGRINLFTVSPRIRRAAGSR